MIGNTSSARVPQILKNWREKSCEGILQCRCTLMSRALTTSSGLSLLFFLLSLIGNLTYGGGVSAFCHDRGIDCSTAPDTVPFNGNPLRFHKSTMAYWLARHNG